MKTWLAFVSGLAVTAVLICASILLAVAGGPVASPQAVAHTHDYDGTVALAEPTHSATPTVRTSATDIAGSRVVAPAARTTVASGPWSSASSFSFRRAAKATTEVAEEVATKQVNVLGRYIGGTERYLGEPGFNVLNVPGKGTGRWNWTRNKRFIDDAIERGDEIRLVTNPSKPLYSGGNTYQRELKYLNKRGYGRFEQSGDYWVARPGR
jgi:hypothetical protein